MTKTINENVLRTLLINPSSGKTGAEIICNCPFCGKEKHFYINSKTNLWNCKKCGREGNLKSFLYGIGRGDLLKNLPSEFSLNGGAFGTMPLLGVKQNEETNKNKIEKVHFPVGFNRVYNSKYLNSRGFVTEDYFFHPVGFTKLKSEFKNYIIIGITQGPDLVGYVGRYIGNNKNKLRYRNSKTKFANFLFNVNSITSKTNTVILCEGVFDVISTENILELKKDDEIKVLGTFGKKLSKSQIQKLKSFPRIKNIILMFDGRDAIEEMKKYSFALVEKGYDVQLGFFEDGDPGSWDKKIFKEVFNNLYSVHNFFYTKLKGI